MDKNSIKKEILLILPISFYSFANFLVKSFTEQGFKVTLANEEYPSNKLGNIMGKFLAIIRLPIMVIITDLVFPVKYINGKRYDIVLIIKGRGISKKIIKELNKVADKVIGYNYDSFKYNRNPLKWYTYLSKYSTFDYRDAEEYNLPIVELFSSVNIDQKIKKITYDISAILKIHSNRLKYVYKITNLFPHEKCFIYLYEPSILTLILNFIKNPIIYWKLRRYIKLTPLSFSDYSKVLFESEFTLDYAHPNQTGITIRSFEAISCQTKIITNNKYVFKNKNFNPSNSLIFDNQIELKEIIGQYSNLKGRIPDKYYRSITEFTHELIN